MNPAKILVVDDELELERLIKQRLRKNISAKEIQLIFARNGKEALEKLQNDPEIEMVLTDINMPEMDGLTLLKEIREVDPTLKAVVLSAYGDMNNIRTAMNTGAFDFLTKPINFEDLAATINKTLKSVRLVRENLDQLHQAQLQLIQSEKMAVLGQFVAGVGHEINNPVGFISGNIDLASDSVKDLINHLKLYQEKFPNPGSEIEQNAEDIDLEELLEDLPEMLISMKIGTERIISISASLNTFSRADTASKVLANIHQCLDSTLMILQHRLKAKDKRPMIQVIKEYGEIPIIKCYPGQLNQVFMNILANAIDACEEFNQDRTYDKIQAHPNTITITTEVSQDNQSLMIKIKDNGKGMSEEVKSKMFDQFFTTKAVGKGTGLGLSISRRIVVETHGGSLSCNSVLGEGTEFVIKIPVH
ncbi:hybrid sensor histidine kinase/response regulator [Microcoleus sp. FACHB-SPT15]|uniref:response regulator n=1 Tax=Microcoleus sp. FACHB-SPT15 TaxID=2692830 RepID=UPI0017862018|nr:response regulator [Microcoleus sp. FACHB-SPT15]MBD1806754.1 hybrid sensor histidine kinase/response regulator [Microcoleus sp. FACHB-SPT15]